MVGIRRGKYIARKVEDFPTLYQILNRVKRRVKAVYASGLQNRAFGNHGIAEFSIRERRVEFSPGCVHGSASVICLGLALNCFRRARN